MRRSRHAPASDRLIVALDFTSQTQAMAMARQLRGLVRAVKVGSVLFTESGPAIIQRLQRLGFEIMLDLKFHDIPTTVELSCRAAAHHRVSLLTVHASGDVPMLEAAVRGARSEAKRLKVDRPLVLGVTVLTSAALGSPEGASALVRQLASRALEAGCDGVVASPREAAMLRQAYGPRLTIVTPGIRPSGADMDDQRRVATPAEALRQGADWLVVGRPIIEAPDPAAAAKAILQEMKTVAC